MVSRIVTKRRDHHCSPILPRWARTAMPPSTASALPPSKNRPSLSIGISAHHRRVEGEQLAQLVGAQIGDPVLPLADHRGGQRLLPLDHRVDLLLERARTDELADLDVAGLADAEGAVGRLVL